MDDKTGHKKGLDKQVFDRISAVKTVEGMRRIVGETLYGTGHARCRNCGSVVKYNVLNENVNVERIDLGQEGFRFWMECPRKDGRINLGEFYPAGPRFEKKGSGDRYIAFKNSNEKGYYIRELIESIESLARENKRSRDELGEGFLDKAWRERRNNDKT